MEFSKRCTISLESALASLAVVIRAITPFLTPREAMALRSGVPIELRQLIMQARAPETLSASDWGQRILAFVSSSLEITPLESKKRVAAFLDELRTHVSPWDELSFSEALARVQAAIESVPLREHHLQHPG